MASEFRQICFIILYHCISFNHGREVIAKYRTYIILERIFNATIVDFNKSIIPLVNTENEIDELIALLNEEKLSLTKTIANELRATTSSLNHTKIPLSNSNATVELVKNKSTTDSSTLNYENIKPTSLFNLNVTKLSTIKYSVDNVNLKNNSVHHKYNGSRPARRIGGLEDKLKDMVMDNLDGEEKRVEQLYEPYWPDGQFVFMRTGSKQLTNHSNQIDQYRECDRHCSVYENVWYGRICAMRRDDWWVDYVLHNFSSLCAMEKANCENPLKRFGWFPVQRGRCTYSRDPHDFLSTFDELYAASTVKFFSRAKSYEEEYGHLYVTP